MRTWTVCSVLVLAAFAVAARGGGAPASVEWIDVHAGGATLRAAVVRPSGSATAPAVVVLHDRGGFKEAYVEIAERFAAAGYVGVAGCWFAGFPDGPVARPVSCPDAPTFRGANLDSVAAIRALLAATRALPGVQAGRVGLWGHSLGATGALFVASTGGAPAAVVASAPRTMEPASRAPGSTAVVGLTGGVASPVLLLHGMEDATVAVQQTRDYEQALRSRGTKVEAHYYAGAPHELPFDASTELDVFRRSIAFFDRHLKAIAAPDITAPVLTLTVARRQSLVAVLRRGIVATIACSEPCSVQLVLRWKGRVVGRRTEAVQRPGRLSVPLTPASRQALRGSRGATLTLSARVADAAGNATTRAATVALRG